MPRAILALLLGCVPPDETAPEPADSHTDEPPDSAGPQETGDGVPDRAFDGSLALSATIDGEVSCETTLKLSGTPYIGECEGCDFALELRVEGADGLDEDCFQWPRYTLLQSGTDYVDPLLGYADTWRDDDGYYVDGALLTGFGSYASTGRMFHALVWDGSAYGSVAYEDGELAWTLSVSGVTPFRYGYAYCETAEYSYAEAGYAAEAPGTSTVACDGSTSDVWVITPVEETASVSVDTVSEDSAFDPVFWVNGPDGCAISFADDNFACTYAPPHYECPAAELSGLIPGRNYQVVVTSAGDCASGEVEYRIDGPRGTRLLMDDVVSAEAWSVEVEGSGTLAE